MVIRGCALEDMERDAIGPLSINRLPVISLLDVVDMVNGVS